MPSGTPVKGFGDCEPLTRGLQAGREEKTSDSAHGNAGVRSSGVPQQGGSER